MTRKLLRYLIALTLLGSPVLLAAQLSIGDSTAVLDYANPQSYTIGGITVSGTKNLDVNAIILLSGLKIGGRIDIPGDDIARTIKKLWSQGLFEDIKISYTKIIDNNIFLDIYIKEQPRLSKFKFNGVKKSDAEELRKTIDLYRERIVTDNLLMGTRQKVAAHYIDKGYLNVLVEINTLPDPEYPDHVIMEIDVKRQTRVKINNIILHDNINLSNYKIRKAMKETRRKVVFMPFYDFDGMLITSAAAALDASRPKDAGTVISDYFLENVNINIFKSSKFIEQNFKDDKIQILEAYRELGYRDVRITKDTLYRVGEKFINLELTVDEGPKYYFRNINWVGNSKFSTAQLKAILGINKGDIYNPKILESRLFMDPQGRDISSIYMDDGYLFFQVTPVEVFVSDDSVDLEIRIYEGQQATIDRVAVAGNTKTNDHVIYRELRTYPGSLFSRSDIIRSQRQLSVLGFFDPEAMNVNPKPKPEDATVDLDYTLEEKPSDQVELSGGFGAGRVVGSLGLTFTNFSMRNLFKFKEWRPLPTGDGQRFSLRGQTSGRWFSSINATFTEPWLGGKKPISFSVSAWHSVQTNGVEKKIKDAEGNKIDNPERQYIKITGFSVGLGKQLKWPDDYFVLRHELSVQNYEMKDWFSFIFSNGFSNNLFYRLTLQRNSLDQIIYPRTGSEIKLAMQITPPYSYFDGRDYKTLEAAQKYKWVEYHKWKATIDWYTPIVQNLVFKVKLGYGIMGYYNGDIGHAPFERFYLGGSGLTGFQLDGREIIALRGYDDGSLSPSVGGTSIVKYSAELRYPLSLNPSATVYLLSFLDAGNSWSTFENFNPFETYRGTGIGVRIFLPMFGLLGLDWGYRLDEVPGRSAMQRSQIHFTIGANLGEL
jgi:outer membrane protein insertion porin family